MPYEPQYSDVCECMHARSDHHNSWLPNGYWLSEECEYWSEKDEEYECPCEHFKMAKISVLMECDLEILIDELEKTDPTIRERIARISEMFAAQREDPDSDERV